jgi:hypothetical protein
LCLPTRGPCRHGIDMSLRLTDLTSDSRWRHWLLAFTALFSRSGSPTSAPMTEVEGEPMSKRHAPDQRPRTTRRFECWCQPSSTVPGHRRRWQTGMRGD